MTTSKKIVPSNAFDFEHKSRPLLPKKEFYRRLVFVGFYAFLILTGCLLIGVLGYHYWGPMGWLDALHNASMILSGMGPVVEIKTSIGKVFSSFYALFSGVAFITNIGILIAPIAHRFFHRLHLEK